MDKFAFEQMYTSRIRSNTQSTDTTHQEKTKANKQNKTIEAKKKNSEKEILKQFVKLTTKHTLARPSAVVENHSCFLKVYAVYQRAIRAMNLLKTKRIQQQQKCLSIKSQHREQWTQTKIEMKQREQTMRWCGWALGDIQSDLYTVSYCCLCIHLRSPFIVAVWTKDDKPKKKKKRAEKLLIGIACDDFRFVLDVNRAECGRILSFH